MNDPGESDLLRRCRKGEEDAWSELFDLHYNPVARFICHFSSQLSREDVEEICQETFLTVIKSIFSFQGQSRFQTWLFRIAANKTHDYIERQHAAKRGGGQISIPLQTPDSDGLTLEVPSSVPGPDLALINQENMALVVEALRHLGKSCREVIELRYFADLSYDEIAETLDMNPKTVSSRLSKCMDQLEVLAARIFSREKNKPLSV